MPLAGLLPESRQRGPALICAGLAIVLVAQMWPRVPIASAIMLIGCGATVVVCTRLGRTELVALMNLTVYALLGCLVVATQIQAALSGPAGRVGVLLVVDHLAAFLLLIIMVRIAIRRLEEFLPE